MLPELLAHSGLAPELLVSAEDGANLAPGGLTEHGGRRKLGEQDEVLNLCGHLAARDGVVPDAAVIVNGQQQHDVPVAFREINRLDDGEFRSAEHTSELQSLRHL